MAPVPPELQTKLAFGRAFLIHLRRGDAEMAMLFARAFVVQGAIVNGVRRAASCR